MSVPNHSRPRRSFGAQVPILEDDDEAQGPSAVRGGFGRMSIQDLKRAFISITRGASEDNETSALERPPIPTMSNESYATPLPVLSMIVLSITMLGEFLSANVSTPFLLFMVKGFGEFKDDAAVAFWTGILVSMFFMTQFLTSLLWATVAEKHGRRAVLMVSLLGSALTCLSFGTSTTLQQAICLRLLQGIFAGAVGVARGSVAFVTDSTNEGRAYAILGFCWGFGGVAGAIIGGSFERPATKWPGVFGGIPVFVKYPYLLPCGLAALVTFTGSVLSCFLAYDGGPRQGAIRLPPEKISSHPPIPEEGSVPPSPIFEENQPTGFKGLQKKISRKFSNYFPERRDSLTPVEAIQPAVPLSSPPLHSELRTNPINGSAYGYGSYRNRLASGATLDPRKGSMSRTLRRRTGSHMDSHRDSTVEGHELNFAQRLLMANENAVTNIADLWVASAMNVDNENPFESDTEAGSDDEADAIDLTRGDEIPNLSSPPDRGRQSGTGELTTTSPLPSSLLRQYPRNRSSSVRHSSQLESPRPNSPFQTGHRRPSVAFSAATSRRSAIGIPSIFAHPGVKTPPAVLDAQEFLLSSGFGHSPNDQLTTIDESGRPSQPGIQVDVESMAEKPPSLTSQLPILIIIQYGVLALHTTTHDQVFMSYLVSDYDVGGLNLNAGHFAQLIALMCLAQIAYQFYLYPNMGPPRGRFSHLAMFRLGSILFIPSYLTVILYRPFANAHDDGNFFVMAALALSTALRYCAITFAYTAISILLNYMTPPSAVGYANGIAQSIVSLARCVGPVIGGYLWSISVKDNPSSYYFGFVVCAGVCALTVAQSFLIR